MRACSGSIRHRLMGAVSQRRCWETGWEEGRTAVGIDPTCHGLSGWPAVSVSARAFGQTVRVEMCEVCVHVWVVCMSNHHTCNTLC